MESTESAPNPFRPGFGRHPHVVVGRDVLLGEYRQLFADGSGRAWATHLEAHRGAGKTVLLDAIQDLAGEAGWTVIQDDAGSHSAGLVFRLADRTLAARDERRPPPRRRVRGAGVSVLGTGANVEFESPGVRPSTFRDALGSLLDVSSNGVLLTIDEIHDASSGELKELGNTAQHLQRDGRPFAIVLAGLPTGSDRGPTFLARCHHPAIGALADHDVASGLVRTASLGAVDIDDRALLRMVDACLGNPYMLQLVGFHAFDRADNGRVTPAAATSAVDEATAEFIDTITNRVVTDLAPRERDFLVSMRRSGRPARIADVREDLGVSSQYVNVYRSRLIRFGLIRPIERGVIDVAMPGLYDALDE